MLLPALVLSFGPKQAVPIMAVAAIVGNISRVILWRKDIHWRAFLAYSVTGVPAAAFGAQTLWSLKSTWIDIALGTFFLLMIPYRHWAKSRNFTLSLWQLSVAGALIGYLTGIVLSTGPLTIPIFFRVRVIERTIALNRSWRLVRCLSEQDNHFQSDWRPSTERRIKRPVDRTLARCGHVGWQVHHAENLHDDIPKTSGCFNAVFGNFLDSRRLYLRGDLHECSCFSVSRDSANPKKARLIKPGFWVEYRSKAIHA